MGSASIWFCGKVVCRRLSAVSSSGATLSTTMLWVSDPSVSVTGKFNVCSVSSVGRAEKGPNPGAWICKLYSPGARLRMS